MSSPASSGRRSGVDDGWLTLVEASWLLGVTDKTVRRLIAAGQLPATRVGSRLRVTRSNVEAFVEASRVPLGALHLGHRPGTVPSGPGGG